MLKKTLSKSQISLNFQAFFSKINGFPSKKPLFQRFLPVFKTFLAIIFLTTVAKIGVTPIFAQTSDEGCVSNGSGVPTFSCPVGETAYRDPEKGDPSGCPSTMKEVTWHTCFNTAGAEYWINCCRNKTAKEICDDRSSQFVAAGKSTQTATYWKNVPSNTTCPYYGTVIAADLQSNGQYGLCCDLGFNNDIDFYQHCKDIAQTSGRFYYVFTAAYGFNGCSDGYNLISTRKTAYLAYTSVDYCCLATTTEEDTPIEEKCNKISGGYLSNLDNNQDGVFECYKSATDKIIFADDNQVCCGPFSSEDTEDFSLNLSVNHLKFQSLLDMNPLQSSSVFSDPESRTPGNIINQALTAVVFPIAGVGLLILILLGGFQVLSGSLGGKQNSIDLGKKRVTAAVIGFTLLFLVYWIWRLIALATGLSV